MGNPWWEWLLLRGSLKALPRSWWAALGWWFAPFVMQVVMEVLAPMPRRWGYLDLLIESVAEVVLIWAILRGFRRAEWFLEVWQLASLGNVVRSLAFFPLAVFISRSSTLTPVQTVVFGLGVLIIAFASLAWMIPYYFRMWKQALDNDSNTLVIAIMAGMTIVMLVFSWLVLSPEPTVMP